MGHPALAGVVVLVDFHQTLPGDLTQPGVEGQRPIAQVAIELLVGFHQHFLDDIGGIEAGQETPVESDGDHLAEPAAVPGEQLLACRPIAGGAAADEFVGVGRSGSHVSGALLPLICGSVA